MGYIAHSSAGMRFKKMRATEEYVMFSVILK